MNALANWDAMLKPCRVQLKFWGLEQADFSSPHEFNQHFGEPLKVLGLSQLETVPSKTAQFFLSASCVLR